jgi:isocitrate/isopropylmalate dehydrogenase
MARITVAHGDGIGPEIMDATLRILKAAEAHGIDVVKTKNLYRFDGTPSYSLGQSQ